MRHSFLRKLLIVSGACLLSASLMSSQAAAQKPKPKPPAGGAAKPTGKPTGKPAGKPGGNEAIELDEPAAPTGTTPTAAAASGPPPVAGQMTEQAAQAKRLFDGEKWGDASLALYRVYKGETGDDEGNKQLSQYHLAISLYRLKFYQAAYGIFSEIADKPNHLKFNETLLWLAKLATDLPEPADIVERVGKYNDAAIEKFNNSNQRELYWQLNYLLGRYKYRNRQYEEALRLFSKVDRQSKYYIKGQFFGGISNVQVRKSVPAVQSFQKVVGAIDEGVEGLEDEDRMRDLAFLSMARTYYSASVRLDENNAPTIDSSKLSAAVKYWNKVDVGSEYWLDALFEESWAYFMAGDYAHALGNVHTIQSPYFPNSYYPEADVLKAVIYFANCQYDDAEVIVAKFQSKYQPIYDDLNKVLGRFKGEEADEPFYKFLKDVRDGKADLPPRIKIVVENALSDRQLLRHLSYVQVLDDEGKRFGKAPASFRDSPLGNDVKDSLQLARDIAVRNAGQLARERYQRNLDELNEHLRDSAKILIDINSAKRNQLDAALAGSQVTAQESERNIVKPDEEHVIWPFDGEYWRDELGFYRQTITSKCGR
jgi:tetratricopeptide (TPR) repeat protein